MAEILTGMDYDAVMDTFAAPLPPTPEQIEGQRSVSEWRALHYNLLLDLGLINDETPPSLMDSLLCLTEPFFNAGMMLAQANPEFVRRLGIFKAGSENVYDHRLDESRKFYRLVKNKLHALRSQMHQQLDDELHQQDEEAN